MGLEQAGHAILTGAPGELQARAVPSAGVAVARPRVRARASSAAARPSSSSAADSCAEGAHSAASGIPSQSVARMLSLCGAELRSWSGDCPATFVSSALAPFSVSSLTISSPHPRRIAAQSGSSKRGYQNGVLAASESASRARRTCFKQFCCRPRNNGSARVRLNGGGAVGTLRHARGVLGGVVRDVSPNVIAL
ncbi:unnamed protein product [Prorocentrum cordatum]|uniref:Uncharacterized protein n=1 Tax=Prorocentrum cordatum TaxID=2364126 RepID=A0ABN9T7M5_9DINO|nr:unnamed protein product [Polarella glacialis]